MYSHSNRLRNSKHTMFKTKYFIGLICTAAMIVFALLVMQTSAAEKEQPSQPSGTLAKIVRDALKAAEAQQADQEQLIEELQLYDTQRKTESESRDKDPAWRASHEQVSVIKIESQAKGEMVHNFCLNLDGNLLVCCGDDRMETKLDPDTKKVTTVKVGAPSEVRVFSPDGKQLRAWSVNMQPQAICVHGDGTIFVGGEGRLVNLSPEGKILSSGDMPGAAKKPKAEPEAPKTAEQPPKTESKPKSGGFFSSLIQALGLGESDPEASSSLSAEERAEIAALRERSQREITGMAVSDQDLFVACRSSEGLGYVVWRMDLNFQNPKLVVTQLSGCCGQMDVQAHDGELWIPENSRHRVNRYDRDGKLLASFGKDDRKAASGFGGCCDPKNVRFSSNGEMYTSESGPPVVVKRFSPDGKFLGVVGIPKFESGCVRVSVEVSKDGKQVYVLNTDDNAIHVLAAKSAEAK
jgi:sugar lactone lactonase YvrE